MTPTENSHGTDPGSARRGKGDWTRELVELAALFLAAGTAHLFVAGMQSHSGGSYALIALSGLIVLVVVGRRLWRHRRRPVEAPAAPADGVDFEDVQDRSRRLWRLRASVTDSPGRLARLAAGLAALGGNIRTVHVHPVADGAVDEVLLHVPARVTEAELIAAVAEAGGRDATATRADVRELDDVPTRTLNLAKDLVNGRSELVRVLRGVLGDIGVQWREDVLAPGAEGLDGATIRLAAPGGGTLVLERSGSSFTPAEYARARAMAELAQDCRGRMRRDTQQVSVDGAELTLRVADQDDLPMVAEFHERCSAAARYRRYFSPGPSGEKGLQRLLTPALGRAVLALAPTGEVVAMGNLMYDGDIGEIALLVRDDWQRRGVGSVLAARLVEEAGLLGIATLSAHTHVDNTAIARTLRKAGLKLVGAPEPGEWCWMKATAPAVA
ncbi:GNAT family N-acetyltransferase [Saccharopolyspora erythraea]|uniref:GNAT family N-acetyltransferase n=1 Tax=Saccharopolyspora erythraea TaxID=1836 RepID=UPI001BAC4030|nr:GNAT family N-acetyltransferase [Saccharopolyspora erythraea]QUH04303.1 GNAT family N-acetyltransferase [Saccharopolyspora erythraea]